MKRILFVDDQPQLLEGLQNLLRRQRKVWEMDFAASGKEALEKFALKPFDVIVSDMRMPIMDGAALLREIQQHYPGTVRIVLSGYTSAAASLTTVLVAHQFLSKPCEAEVLRSVVERACRVQDLIRDEKLQSIVGKIDKLPSLPRIYTQLVAAIGSPTSSVADIVAILQQDIAMSAKVLQLVNSSFFRLARRITSVQEAVSYLGLETVKSLVLTSEVFALSAQSARVAGISLEQAQDHALKTALLARRLLPRGTQADDAFTAGMLHDVGKLILATQLPEQYRTLSEQSSKDGRPLFEHERALYGICHAEVGAYLLGTWGLPSAIVEAVADHHEPGRSEAPGFDVVGAVHVANALVLEANGEKDTLDMAFLERVGAAEQLTNWRRLVNEGGTAHRA
jgi:putative nucleotidyltransferase with HDIG domain